jgi:hypothetical protein
VCILPTVEDAMPVHMVGNALSIISGMHMMPLLMIDTISYPPKLLALLGMVHDRTLVDAKFRVVYTEREDSIWENSFQGWIESAHIISGNKL